MLRVRRVRVRVSRVRVRVRVRGRVRGRLLSSRRYLAKTDTGSRRDPSDAPEHGRGREPPSWTVRRVFATGSSPPPLHRRRRGRPLGGRYARRRTRRLQLRRSERSRDAISRATQREWAHRAPRTKRTYERIDTAGDGSVVGCSCVLDGWEGSGRKRLDRNGAKKARVSRRHARLRGAPGPDRGRIWRFGSNRWVLRTGPDGVGTADGARRPHAGRA